MNGPPLQVFNDVVHSFHEFFPPLLFLRALKIWPKIFPSSFRTSNMPGVGTQMVDATSYLSQGFGPIPGVRIYLLIKVIVIRFKVSLNL